MLLEIYPKIYRVLFMMILFAKTSFITVKIGIHLMNKLWFLCQWEYSSIKNGFLKKKKKKKTSQGAVELSQCQCRRHRFDLWSRSIAHAVERLSPCTTTTQSLCSRARELQLPSPRGATTEARVPQSPCFTTREVTAMRACASQRKSSARNGRAPARGN